MHSYYWKNLYKYYSQFTDENTKAQRGEFSVSSSATKTVRGRMRSNLELLLQIPQSLPYCLGRSKKTELGFSSALNIVFLNKMESYFYQG